MKKFYYLTIILLLAGMQLSAQQASRIRPVKIMWVADGDSLTIEQAQTRGVRVPSKLEIVVILDSRTIGKLNGQKLEFKWFKQGPTRQVITNNFYKEINTSAPGKEAYTLSTGRSGLRAGWWKVQIESYADRKLLAFDNKQEFWIQLK
ncbi:MAG: hypothetical protein HC831_07970 [Chloroflexia bacterium]|nr:hypothetical protein [Chloroflexia bacterium]